MKKTLNILFWAIIAAAFIGPGTVATAAKSGTSYGLSLLWALTFSTIACLVLQEASARLTVLSGRNLGEAIRNNYRDKSYGLLIILLVVGAIILGNAAYEAGNILGGVSGAMLGTGISKNILTLIIGLSISVLLFLGTTKIVARILGFVVAVMGIVFLITAVLLMPNIGDLLSGLLIPSLPDGSGLLVLGLIGTTVVPYNIFLGSGIAKGQKVKEIRFGLIIAILFGGIISMAVLVVGTAISGSFSFQALADALRSKLGEWANLFFAVGLFSAGFSSAITAPLAASITAKSLFAKSKDDWNEKSWKYRLTWMIILAIGVFFGLADFKPIEVIILAQALNGLVLPFIAIFLITIVNDASVMGKENINSGFLNIVTGLVVLITIILGITNLSKAAVAALDLQEISETTILIISLLLSVVLFYPVFKKIKKNRSSFTGS